MGQTRWIFARSFFIPETMRLVPLRQRHVGIVLEARIGRKTFHLDPWRLRVQEAVDVLWRLGKRGIDRAGVGVHQIGPVRIPHPEGGAATLAEVASAAAQVRPSPPAVGQPGAVDAQVALAADLHGSGYAAEIDCIASGAGGLAADRAVAAHEGDGRISLKRELDAAAVAGAFEVHLSLLSNPGRAGKSTLSAKPKGGVAHAVQSRVYSIHGMIVLHRNLRVGKHDAVCPLRGWNQANSYCNRGREGRVSSV